MLSETSLSNMHSIIATAIWNIRFWFGSPCSSNSQEFYIAAYYTNGNYFSHKSIAYLVTSSYGTDGDGISRPINHAAHARFFSLTGFYGNPATIWSICKWSILQQVWIESKLQGFSFENGYIKWLEDEEIADFLEFQ